MTIILINYEEYPGAPWDLATFQFDEETYFECWKERVDFDPLTLMLAEMGIRSGGGAAWDHDKHTITEWIFTPDVAKLLKEFNFTEEQQTVE